MKSDIDPRLIIPLFYLFADVTQSHARCSFIQSLKGNIFVIFLVKIKANHLDALGLPIFLRLNVVSKPTEQRKKKNLDDNLEAKNPFVIEPG